ncbi:MAG: hypothetical protein O3A88_01340 [Proteobacteria bacterium]|nr:hypothetical protein [Pseudomonadota bacterium]
MSSSVPACPPTARRPASRSCRGWRPRTRAACSTARTSAPIRRRPPGAWQTFRKKIQTARERGYATASEEIYLDDLSFASAIIGSKGYPEAALTIATSKTRYDAKEAEEKFAPLVVVAARSLSRAHPVQTQ